jgi:predicted amidophosphoribosyltransferase
MCTNLQCKVIYLVSVNEINNLYQPFCPKCKLEILHSHIVQCENCQTILNFIPALKDEETAIFYVNKCSSCSGNVFDNKKLDAHFASDPLI